MDQTNQEVEEMGRTETFGVMIDIALAHKQEAEAKGFSPDAAEAMAVGLHSGLVARYFTSHQDLDEVQGG